MLITALAPPEASFHETMPELVQGRATTGPPRILVFDSGLGGLTVLAAIVTTVPDGVILYAADDAVFPYGRLDEAALVGRVMAVMERLVAAHRPDIVVVACNTASTAVLPPLRARWPHIAVVGTVPAIKPAAACSTSRLISVLATPGCVARQYTRDLVARFAGDCAVTLVGSVRLAGLAEAAMRGEPVADEAVRGEIAPAFVEAGGQRTDAVVLACTHYPLLLPVLERVQPWPVRWVDPAPAIARRVRAVWSGEGEAGLPLRTGSPATIPAVFTSGRAPGPALAAVLAGRSVRFQPGEPF